MEELHTALSSERDAAAADLSLQLADASGRLQQQADADLQAAADRYSCLYSQHGCAVHVLS